MTSSDEERGRSLGPPQFDASDVPDRGDASTVSPIQGKSTGEGSVVAIGASAGGLEPLREFLRALPPDSGAAFVVLQHLSPDAPSLTPELLQPHVGMALRQAEEGAWLRPNEVVFLPSGASMQIKNGRLRLARGEARRPTHSVIDTFLHTLAREHGPRAVGVLLSGGGWDGTRGLTAIKEAGGLTMVQDPDSAEFDSMPASAIKAGVADVVQPPAGLAGTLVDYLGRSQELADLDGDGLMSDSVAMQLTKALKAQTGHDFAGYKRGSLTRRALRRCHLQGYHTLGEYVAEVERSSQEAETLLRDLLISVTTFFRDPEAWEVLERRVIPELLRGRGRHDQIRAWVVACATGEEAYSLAMLLDERAEELPDPPSPMVFATDIDEQALQTARDGVYPEGSLTAVSAARRERYFTAATSDGTFARTSEHLREECLFAVHNVFRDPPFSRLDLISCRNLSIYLEPRAQQDLAEILAFALKPGGYLVLGSSESLQDGRGLFEPIDPKHRIFRRTAVPASLPTGVLGRPAITQPAWLRERRGAGVEDSKGEGGRRGVEKILLQEFGPAALLVNDRREVLAYFGRTRNYIEPSEAQGGRNVIEMALPSLRGALRTTIREAEQEHREVVQRSLLVEASSGTELVDLTVRPIGRPGEEDRFLVVFEQRRGGEMPDLGEQPVRDDSATAVRELEEELRDTQESLYATIQQLETANEELQSANEELLSVNEELQTAKEEALSVNEELELVNAELRTKMAELDKAHTDLQNLFQSTQVATLFLDRDRRIRRFTPTIARLFRIRDTDMGRPIEEITARFDTDGLNAAIAGVLDTLEPVQMEVCESEKDVWYSLRVSPYRTVEEAVEGVVLTFADVTVIKQNEQKIREQQLYAQSIIETVEQPLVVLDANLRVVSASRSFFEAFEYPPDDVIGTSLFELGKGEWDVSELQDRLDETLPAGETVGGVELEFELPGRGRRWMIARARRLFSRETDRILLNLHDITDYRERVRAREEEARRKDWFLAMLGHELRGPLAPIRNSIALLRQGAAEGEKGERLFEIIDRQVTHLARLVHDLLDLSRIAEGKLVIETKPLDLVGVVRETVEDYRNRVEEAGLRFDVELPERPLWMEADGGRLGQAIANLIENAQKYTEEGGSIRVRLRAATDDAAEVVVEDTGIGMSPRTLNEAFEPFRQGPRGPGHADEGLGVGLTLVRTVADMHGGSVLAESEGPDLGSRLTLRLPLTRGGERPPGGAAPDAPAKGAAEVVPRRIVLIEDHESVAETTHQLLTVAGHSVTTVGDAAKGIKTIRKVRPGVVICDLGLPGGTSGHEVARTIRSDPELSSIYLIALTGFGQDKDRTEAAQSGFDAFLVKPASEQELAEVLAQAPVGGDD